MWARSYLIKRMGVFNYVILKSKGVGSSLMAELVRKRSSGRQRLRQGYVGKTFTLDGRQYVVEDVIAEGNVLSVSMC